MCVRSSITFCSLWVMVLWTWVYKYLPVFLLSYLGYIIKSRNAESWGDLYVRFWKLPPVLSSSCVTYVTVSHRWGFWCLHRLVSTVVFSWRHFWGWGFDNSNLGYEVVACGLGLLFFFFLMINGAGHLCTCWLLYVFLSVCLFVFCKNTLYFCTYGTCMWLMLWISSSTILSYCSEKGSTMKLELVLAILSGQQALEVCLPLPSLMLKLEPCAAVPNFLYKS